MESARRQVNQGRVKWVLGRIMNLYTGFERLDSKTDRLVGVFSQAAMKAVRKDLMWVAGDSGLNCLDQTEKM